MSRPRISEAQAQAEALARRAAPFASESRTSTANAYDFRRRQPRDLRDAVELVRRAYADEVPSKLHSGAELAADGTPAMTPKAEAYIFGGETWTDAGRSNPCTCGKPERDVRGILMRLHDRICPALDNKIESHFLTPFRATLSEMERAREESTRRRARIVKHVTIGGQGPQEAAIAERAHPCDAKLVAEDAIRSFLRRLTDVKVDAGTVAA